jgi:hypothetical protein
MFFEAIKSRYFIDIYIIKLFNSRNYLEMNILILLLTFSRGHNSSEHKYPEKLVTSKK